MGPLLLATTLSLHPFELVRVDDPNHPEADAVSATGAVLLAPPSDGAPYTFESVPHVDFSDAFVATEAVEVTNVDLWHKAGFTGEGVKVAVFDLQWFGFEAEDDFFDDYDSHDCYTHPSCEPPLQPWSPRFGFETGAHGVACAESVRAIAPGAELHLVRVNGRTTLENAVDWAIREDVDVVSMSMSFFNNSFYDGTGVVADEVQRLSAAGVLMVSSSGNYGNSHWRGPYVDADRDGRMDFDGDNALYVYLTGAGSYRGAYVNWNQHATCGATDLDAYFTTLDGEVVGRSEETQSYGTGRCSPVERLTGYVQEAGWHRLEVRLAGGAEAGVDVDVLASGSQIWGAMAEGSMADPGVHPAVLAVGAVDVVGYLDNEPRSYSSQGPTISGVAKPELAAPDGFTSSVYGPLGFTGTSASAPVVAGLIAVVMSAEEGRTAQQARELLYAWAWETDPTWEAPDPRWGAGKVRLPALDGGSACSAAGTGSWLLGWLAMWSLARRRREGSLESP